ncbi:hypothetical protein M2145_000518 [Lachnospiraceae bacterium PF1-21]|uniref:hypothetical protein n=1 Tax=Ohessyouella blattaphilus TaxID=2949333 RepID=UPI003E270706
MRDYIKGIVKNFLLIALFILIGVLLMLAVYKIPTDKIEKNVGNSVEIFEKEDYFPYIIYDTPANVLDNYTDIIMLQIAAYSDSGEGSEKALLNNRGQVGEEAMPLDDLKMQLSGDGMEKDYARYWHGYLVILKPLLSIMNYEQIRILNCIMVMLSIMVLFFLIYRKRDAFLGMSMLLLLVVLNPVAIALSLQYSSCFYVLMLGLYGVLGKRRMTGDTKKLMLFFCTLGILTSFVDLLTYPLIIFGVPMAVVFWTWCCEKRAFSKQIKDGFFIGVSWFMGYALMWSGKWFVVSLFTNRDMKSVVASSIKVRLASESYGENISMVSTFIRNIRPVITVPFIIVSILILIIMLFIMKRETKKVSVNKNSILLLLMSLLPLIWYAVIVNHSYVHRTFTYRSMGISVVSLFLWVCSLLNCEAKKPRVH